MHTPLRPNPSLRSGHGLLRAGRSPARASTCRVRLSQSEGTIDWGDGTATSATFLHAKNGVEVVGEHTFAQSGAFSVSVTVLEGQLLRESRSPPLSPPQSPRFKTQPTCRLYKRRAE